MAPPRTKILFFGVFLGFVLIVMLLHSVQEELLYHNGDDYEYWAEEVFERMPPPAPDEHDKQKIDAIKESIDVPIILWWTPFTGEKGAKRKCGTNECFFTVDRHYRDHPQTQVFMFYGTDFHPFDLPLPRKGHHEWALLHEESPKNNYRLSQPPCLQLFNHTATFQQTSDFPLTLQYLADPTQLTTTKYLIPTQAKGQGGLAPVAYVQSACHPPSDRDSFVQELMRHIAVDSYGQCLHNKDLPIQLQDAMAMHDDSFLHILAKYKFVLALENALCRDYITEKLWRVLKVGSVPVYQGSPSVGKWLPSNHSAILVADFETPEALARYLKRLDRDDGEYDRYLDYKRRGVTNRGLLAALRERTWAVHDHARDNFVSGFECLVCDRVHANRRRAARGQPLQRHVADGHHLECPRPQHHSSSLKNPEVNLWLGLHDQAVYQAQALNHFVLSGRNYSQEEFGDYTQRLRQEAKHLKLHQQQRIAHERLIMQNEQGELLNG